jgi:hypothetical protein
MDMGDRSYIPQLGRFLQPDPVVGGSANAYAYTFGDPVNSSDPSGASTIGVPPVWAIQAGTQVAEEAVARRAAEEAAARAEAERKIREAIEAKARAAGPSLMEIYASEGVIPGGGLAGGVIWEAEGAGCSGTSACTSSFLGIKVELGEIDEWWKQVKSGFDLIKETYAQPLVEDLRENSTVCKAVGYATAVGSYFIPETRFAKSLGVVLGFGTTYAC